MAGTKQKVKQTNGKPIRVADNGYKFPEQLPIGEILIDSLKNEWVLGKAIARGGFGEIYEARPSLIKSNLPIKKNKDFEYVIKVDHLQGPLFCEMNFYIRVAKHEFITKWMSEKGIKFIGIPSFVATGVHTKGSSTSKNGKTINSIPTKYRFLVMPRFGSDLQKILDSNKLRLPLKTAYTIGIKVLDILEYIHSHGYIHADIKASNLLLSFNKTKSESNIHDEIWLVDFGLVEKYLQGDNSTHKPYGEDLRRANNGTIEFTSRDAHIGCFSRKGDIEILAYNLLSWLSGGRLPWMSNLVDKTLVKNLKNNYMNRLDDLLNYAFSDNKNETVTNNSRSKSSNKIQIPDGIAEFFKQVIKMKYDEKPNYKLLRSILEKAIISNGEKYDGTFYLTENDKKKSLSLKESKDKISPLKRKHPSSKSVASEKSNNFSDISVIFDESTEEDEEDLSSLPKKPRNKASSNGVNSNGIKSITARKSPTVLNTKVASNGTTKSSMNLNTPNGKSSSVNQKIAKSNGKILLNENGINKLNKKLIVDDEISLDDDLVDSNNIKARRRNPSRRVKNGGLIDSSPPSNENNKFVNEPVKNGRVKSTKVFKTDLKSTENQNQVTFQGKVFSNPTPAMLELFNRLNGKVK